MGQKTNCKGPWSKNNDLIKHAFEKILAEFYTFFFPPFKPGIADSMIRKGEQRQREVERSFPGKIV